MALIEVRENGETVWESFGDDEVLIQTVCGNCEKGMLYSPARFCPECSGSGFIVRAEKRGRPCQP